MNLIKGIITTIFAVCAFYTLFIYCISWFFCGKENPGLLRTLALKSSKVVLKIFTFVDRILVPKIIIIAAIVLAVLCLILEFFSTNINFIVSLVTAVLVGGGLIFGCAILKLVAKGLAVAMGKAMENLGDKDAMDDTLREIGGKYIVYEDEDPSMHPDDLVALEKGTKAEAIERSKIYAKEFEEAQRKRMEERREQEAHWLYLDAEKRYRSASARYRAEVQRGADPKDILQHKADMEKALADMKRSGYSGS